MKNGHSATHVIVPDNRSMYHSMQAAKRKSLSVHSINLVKRAARSCLIIYTQRQRIPDHPLYGNNWPPSTTGTRMFRDITLSCEGERIYRAHFATQESSDEEECIKSRKS